MIETKERDRSSSSTRCSLQLSIHHEYVLRYCTFTFSWHYSQPKPIETSARSSSFSLQLCIKFRQNDCKSDLYPYFLLLELVPFKCNKCLTKSQERCYKQDTFVVQHVELHSCREVVFVSGSSGSATHHDDGKREAKYKQQHYHSHTISSAANLIKALPKRKNVIHWHDSCH